jgi:hypothetical protein
MSLLDPHPDPKRHVGALILGLDPAGASGQWQQPAPTTTWSLRFPATDAPLRAGRTSLPAEVKHENRRGKHPGGPYV